MKVFKQIVFFLLLGLVIFVFNRILTPKDENFDKYKIFNNLEENSIDICYTGTSTPDMAINPAIIDETVGCESFNYSVTGARVQHLYYRIVDMLKTQNPSLLVIDTTVFIPIQPNTKGMLLRWAFNSLPFSENKLDAINDLVNKEDRLDYLNSYPLYHTRIFELTSDDFSKGLSLYNYPAESIYPTPSQDGWRNNGTESLERVDDFFENDFSEIIEEIPIQEEQKEYLDKIVKLADENDMQILFISVPYKYTQEFTAEINVKINNYLRNNYESDSVKFFDMNTMYKEIGFDYYYLKDEGHANEQGASLISKFLAEYIKNNYNFD